MGQQTHTTENKKGLTVFEKYLTLWERYAEEEARKDNQEKSNPQEH